MSATRLASDEWWHLYRGYTVKVSVEFISINLKERKVLWLVRYGCTFQLNYYVEYNFIYDLHYCTKTLSSIAICMKNI